MKKTILLFLALAAAGAASAQKLVIKGSDTLGAKLVPMLAEDYKSRNAGVTFEIAAEGSTTGISASAVALKSGGGATAGAARGATGGAVDGTVARRAGDA